MTSSQLACQLIWQSAAPVSQRSWVQIPCTPEFFFQALFSLLLKQCALLRGHFYSRLYLQFKNMTFIYSQPFIHHFTGLFGTNIKTSSQLACQLIWQSAAWYHRGHGFKSRTGLNFTQTLFSLLLKQCALLRGHFYSRLYLQFKNMTFIYSQPFIHHFTGLFGTNIKTSSQLACQLIWQSAAPVSKRSWVQIPCRPECFFQALFSLLLKQCALLRGSLSFTSLSAVQIYDFYIFLAVYSSLNGFIQNQHDDQLPVGLLAQLVEHCMVSQRSWVQIPYRPEFFSDLVFTTA